MPEHNHDEIYNDLDGFSRKIKRLEQRIRDLESKNVLWFMFEEDSKEEEDSGDLTLWKMMIERDYEK